MVFVLAIGVPTVGWLVQGGKSALWTSQVLRGISAERAAAGVAKHCCSCVRHPTVLSTVANLVMV